MNSSPVIWVDGERLASLPLPDRGLELGDGLFETLLAHRAEPLFLDLHLERLRCGLDMLGIDQPLESLKRQLQSVSNLLAQQAWEWASIRVTVTRGCGERFERGYAPPESATPRVIIQAYQMQRNAGEMQPPSELGIGELQLSIQPALAGLKHLNRLEQVLAAQEAKKRGFDDLLLMDQTETVSSCIAGNVFVVRGGTLVTPPIVSCGVAGTRRRIILERWGGQCGYEVEVAPLTLAEVLDAQEVFCTNSLVTVRSIASIGDQVYSSADAANAVFECFAGSLQ
ncbi:MAG: aminodeoxychorismate lyase [Halioglobus sp.]